MKRFFALFLSLTISLCMSFSSFANVATASDAVRLATGAEADQDDVPVMDDYSVMLFDADGIMPRDAPDVQSTSALTGVGVGLSVGGSYFYKFTGEDGRYSYTLPSSVGGDGAFLLELKSKSLPYPGKYKMTVQYLSDVGGYTITSPRLFAIMRSKNVAQRSVDLSKTVSGFTYNFAGQMEFVTDIDISDVDVLGVGFKFTGVPKGFSFSGKWNLRFERLKPSASVDSTAGDPYSAEDSMAKSSQQIADNTAQIVSGQETVKETIVEQVAYIIQQINAFWNQLAAQFTNLYSKMDAQHEEDMNTWNENTQNIIDSQEQNTDTVVNGYDNSQMNQDNDRLNQSINEYDAAEKDVMSGVNDGLNGINFDYDFDSYLGPIKSVSGFLQRLYESSGGLKVAIDLTLIVSIASVVIGVYRIKGG